MKGFTISLIVLLVVIGPGIAQEEEENCDVNRVLGCSDYILQANTDAGEGLQAICSGAQQAYECLEEFVTDCVDEEDRAEYQSELDEMQESVSNACEGITNSDDDGDINENLACLSTIEEDTLECAEEVLGDILLLALTENYSENKIKCVTYGKIIKCVVNKVKASCGEDIGLLFKSALDDATPDEIQQACDASGTSLKKRK